MQSCVLLFGLDPMENAMVKSVLSRCGLNAITPERAQYSQPLGQLAGQTLPFFACGNAPHNTLAVPVLVFCDTAEGQMEEALGALRGANVGRSALKAVLTPTNSLWNVFMLANELVQEHAKITQQMRKQLPKKQKI